MSTDASDPAAFLATLRASTDDVEPLDLTPPRLDGTPRGPSGYVEGSLLGTGGLGEVLEAFDLDLRRTLALKRLRADHSGSQQVARLVEEAQITAQLEHPNIPPVHALGVDAAGRPFFTMTRIEGMSLARLIAARSTDREVAASFGTARLLRIFLQVCYALAFAHSRSVIHRDIKPDNVMLGKFGEVRLMDWGIAKVMPGAPRSGDLPAAPAETSELNIRVAPGRLPSAVGAVIGTPGYMSPEQALGHPDLDSRTDVFALGALLYELLSGVPAIPGANASEKLRKTVAGQIVPLPEVCEVAAPLAGIVQTAMRVRRQDRYPTVLALIEDVEAFLEGRALLSAEEGILSRAGRFYVSRHPRIARLRFVDIDTLAAACLLMGLAIGGWTAAWLAGLEWVALVAGILLAVPFCYTWFRGHRPDDPSLPGIYREGVSQTITPQSASTMPRGPTERDGTQSTLPVETPPR